MFDNFSDRIDMAAEAMLRTSERLKDIAQEIRDQSGQDKTVLRVPYLSQWGTGADQRRGDCGPADVAMLVHHFTSWRPTVDQVADACGQPSAGVGSQYTGHHQLRVGARKFGVSLETRSPYTERGGESRLSMELLIGQVTMGMPSIALVHYGVLRDATNAIEGTTRNQDQNFERGHWLLVVGYDRYNVYVNDPDYWGARAIEGHYREVPWQAFESALSAVAPGCTVGYQGLVVTRVAK